MGEKILHEHTILVFTAELGNVGGDRALEIQEIPLVKDHRERRRNEDLRERGKIENRIDPHPLGAVVIAHMTESSFEHDLAAPRDENDRTRRGAVFDSLFHEARGLFEPARRKTDILRISHFGELHATRIHVNSMTLRISLRKANGKLSGDGDLTEKGPRKGTLRPRRSVIGRDERGCVRNRVQCVGAS